MQVTIAKARQEFSEVVNRTAYGKERVIITRRGKQLVAMVPIDDLKVLDALDEAKIIAAAKTAWQESEGRDAISIEQAKRELGIE